MKSLNEIFGETKQQTQVKPSVPASTTGPKRSLDDIFGEKSSTTSYTPTVKTTTQPTSSSYTLPVGYDSSPDILDVSATYVEEPKKSLLSRFTSNFFSPTIGTSGKTQKQKLDETSDIIAKPVLEKLNTPTGKRFMTSLEEETRGSKMLLAPIVSTAKFWGDLFTGKAPTNFKKDIEQFDTEWKLASADEKNSMAENVLRGVVDAGPQSLVGVALNLVPFAGPALSATYFSALSGAEQIQKKGEVYSFKNIATDVAGDMILGGTVETILKKPVSTLVKSGLAKSGINFGKGFLVEGITEPSQTLIKYANDYHDAKTVEDKAKIVADAKNYVKNGGMLLEFLVGGLSGALITGGAGMLGADVDPNIPKPKIPVGEKDDKKFTEEQNKYRENFREDVKDNLKENMGNRSATSTQITQETGIPKNVADQIVDVIVEENPQIITDTIGNLDIDAIIAEADQVAQNASETQEEPITPESLAEIQNDVQQALGLQTEAITEQGKKTERKLSEIEQLIKDQQEGGYSDFEIARNLQKDYKISLKEANDEIAKYVKSTKEVSQETEVKPTKEPKVTEISYPNKEPEKGVQIYAGIKDGVAKIESIEISPSKQKQGLGTKYVNEIIDWAKKNGATKIEIGAYKKSIGFWEKMGFDLEKEFPTIGGVIQDYKYGVKELLTEPTKTIDKTEVKEPSIKQEINKGDTIKVVSKKTGLIRAMGKVLKVNEDGRPTIIDNKTGLPTVYNEEDFTTIVTETKEKNTEKQKKGQEVFEQESYSDYTEEENIKVAKVANEYWDKVILPEITNGETVVIGADDLKDYFNNDYAEKNHKIYSRAAFRIYMEALPLVENTRVILTGGGPASGKTDFLIQPFKDEKFDGIIYDSNMANYNGVLEQKKAAEKYGKNIKIEGIIPDLNRASDFAIQREKDTKRGINSKTFANGHVGFPETIVKLLENGIFTKDDISILDTRDTGGDQTLIINKIINKDFLNEPLAVLKGLGYTREAVQKLYEQKQHDIKEYGRKGPTSDGQGNDQVLRESRISKGEDDGQGDRGSILQATRGEESKGTIDSLESYNNFRKEIRAGNITVEEFKQAFANFIENKEAIKEELGKKSKDAILKQAMSWNIRSSDKKEKILDQAISEMQMWFTIGRTLSYSIGGRDASTNALTSLVEKTTQEDIDAYVRRIAEQMAERATKIAEFKKAVTDPVTLEDFKTFIETNGKEKLSDEQLVRYEDLIALQAKEKEAKELKEKGVIAGVKTDTTMTMEETTNTKTGEPLFKVKMADRIAKDQYIAINNSAKKLGGYYSRFAKGFLFKNKTDAEAFMNVGKGEKVETTRPEEMQAEKEQNTAEKLATMADRLETVAEEKLNRDRKTNTVRRANSANSIEADARKELATAQTMKNLASAIASGEAKLLNRVSTKTQIETLDQILTSANYKQTREDSKTTGTFKTDVPIDNKTVEYVTEYVPTFYIKGLEEAVIKGRDTRGLKLVAERVSKSINKAKAQGKEYYIPSVNDMYEIIKLNDGLPKQDVAWFIPENVANFKRLQAMGINSIEQLRATLREYIKFKETPASADKVKQLEREIIGKKVGIDFFPTPMNVAERMVNLADIEDGMKVLEPSAGNGNIADAIRETGVSPDVAEISGELRNILEAKGYTVVAHDFLKINDKYDRIVMNPPFAAGMDAVHLKHAFDILNPGGKVISIIGEGSFIRSDKASTAFREWLDEVGATVDELPAGTFKDTDLLATTGASARLVEIYKPEIVKYKLYSDLTTKILKDLEGETTVSKQYILDATNRGELKQVERDITRQILDTIPDGPVNVKDFAKKVKAELLPLKRRLPESGGKRQLTRYENIALPEDLRGNVKNYSEVLYESPVKTSAGDVHFGGSSDSYFGHTRIEDMADNKTRRVIEVQSDLYQKGNLERELNTRPKNSSQYLGLRKEVPTEQTIREGVDKLKSEGFTDFQIESYINEERSTMSKLDARTKEVSKLQQYNDPTAHFRMVREEIKKASQDGKTKLQFPTGETAMKIEGLGSENNRWIFGADNYGNGTILEPRNMKNGLEIFMESANGTQGDSWIITDVLGDGKFKAVPKDAYEKFTKNGGFKIEDINTSHLTEEFDISGKVDTSNPIYKFYEKDVAKYLNKFGGKRVVDDKGVSWIEVPITKEQGKAPVEAFKIGSVDNPIWDRTLEETQARLNEIFGREVPLKEVFNAEIDLGNPYAYARATKNLISLLNVNNSFSEAIANHEGWHWFKMQLSLGEQARIREIELEWAKQNEDKMVKIREVYSKIPGYETEASMAEELMADTLFEYTKTGKTVVDKIKAWFDRAIFKLKLLFSGRKDLLKLFRNIKTILDETTGNNLPDGRGKFKIGEQPEFNTGDKIKNAKLTLENAEKNGASKERVRKVNISGVKIELPQDLQQQAMALEFESEMLNENPLNNLWVYANKREGVLPEGGGGKDEKSIFGRSGDDIVSREEFMRFADEQGRIDTETIREEFSKFVQEKRDHKERVKQHRAEVKQFMNDAKDTIALNKLSDQSEKKMIADIKAREEEARKERVRKAIEEGQAQAKIAELKRQERIRTINKANTTRIKEIGFWNRVVGQKLNPLKYTDRVTQKIFHNWNNKILQGSVRADKEAKEFTKITGGIDTILKYEAGKDTEYSKDIKEKFDSLRKEAIDRGVDLGFRANYLPHVYAEDSKQIEEKIRQYLKDKGLADDMIVRYENGEKLPDVIVNTLKINPFFSKERIFPTYQVAMEYGLTPKYTHIAQLVGHYIQEMETIVANNNLVKELDDAGKILPFEDAPVLKWEMVNLPFSQKGYMAPPNVAKVINSLFGKQEPTFWTYMAKLSKKMQEIKLSAGLPYTTVNFFAIGQLVKEITSGNFKAINSFYRANFNRKSMEWMQDNRNYIYMMGRQGINLRETVDSWENLYNNLSEIKGIGNKAGEIFDRMFNKKTFMTFMPMMQVQLFKDTYNAFIKKGYTADIAEEFAGRVVSNNFGLSKFSGRSKKTQDQLSAIFFAPTFREGIINTLYNTGKAGVDIATNLGGLKGPLDPTLINNRKLLAGMTITWVLYNLLNAYLNDDDDDENGKEWMFNNPKNRKFALQIPTDDGTLIYVEFMPSFLAFARNMISGAIALPQGDFDTAKQKLGSVLSMPLKTGSEVWANRDYFDRQIYKETDTGGQKAVKVAQHLGLSVTHPYISETIYQLQDKKPLYQSVITGLELPLKFSTKDKVAQGEYYDAIDKKAKENTRAKEKVQPVYEEIQKLKKAGNLAEATKLYDTLSEDDKIVYNKIKQNPYEKKQQKIGVYEDAIKDLETKSLSQVEKDIAKELYDQKPTKAQQSTVNKDFTYYKEYTGYKYKSEADELKGMTSNENKILYLKSLKKKLSDSDYKEFISKGRKKVRLASGKTAPVLISDEVLKKIR